MGTTIIFRRGENDPTSGSGLTLAEPAFNTTLKTFHIGLGHGVTAAWVGAPISGLSADIAAGITYKIPTASAVKNYIGGLCYGNTGAATITQYVSSFNGLTGAVGGVCAAQSNTFTALQSFASGISASGITVGGSMTVTGNLTVSGGVTFTISENVLIEDNIIVLNSNVTGSPSENAGIEIERGTSANVQLLWNESSDKWTFTNDGSTYYDLPTSVVTSFNGLTGAVGGVCAAQTNTFVPIQYFVGGLCSGSGITAESTVSSVGFSTISGYGAYQTITTVSSDTVKFAFDPSGDNSRQTLRPSDDVPDLAGSQIINRLPASSGILALTSQLMGAVNGSTAATTAVTSFNGLTGAVGGVCAAQANTFTALQTFSSGLTATGITTGSITNNSSISVTSKGGTVTLRGITSGTALVSNSITLSPLTTTNLSLNSVTGIVDVNKGWEGGIQSAYSSGLRFVNYDESFYYSNTLMGNASADRTIYLPDASGTLALTSQLMGAVNGSTAATTAVTSFNGLTGAVQGVSSWNGQTGAISFVNYVASVDGATGAITNVARTNTTNIFTASQTVSGNFATLTVEDTDSYDRISLNPSTNKIVFYDDNSGNDVQLYVNSFGNQLITFPDDTTTLAGRASTQTFTGVNTFSDTTNFNAGISAAGGTFSALTRFTAGISAAGGVTLSGTLQGTTGSFSRLLTASAGISAAGGVTLAGTLQGTTGSFSRLLTASAGISAAGGVTFSGNVTAQSTLYTDTILANGSQISIANVGGGRVAIGDYDSAGNSTFVFIRDNTSTLYISNPFGDVSIGDPNGVDSGYALVYNAAAGYLDGGNSSLTNFSSGSFGALLTASAGISADGSVTFGGTVASDTGYRITSNAIKAQTGTTYTFLESDNGKIVTFNSGSAVTVTIPTGLPTGFNCTAIQLGVGQVGFTAAIGLTMNSYGNQYRLIGQHASASIIEYTANTVNLSGNLVV